jgi:hypothetical protein
MSNSALEDFQKGMAADIDRIAGKPKQRARNGRSLEALLNQSWGTVNNAADGDEESEFHAAAVAACTHPDYGPDTDQELLDIAASAHIDQVHAQRIISKAKQQSASKPVPASGVGHHTPAPLNGHATEEPPPALDPNDYADTVPATIDVRPSTIVPATLTTPIAWPQEAPPPIDWLVAGRIPRGDVTTLSGDGGAGKTDIALQLAANVARGAVDWLGHEIASGPVVLVSGEEPEREIRRRLWLHATRGGYSFSDLADLHQWFPDKSGDAVLAVPEFRSGTPTHRCRHLACRNLRRIGAVGVELSEHHDRHDDHNQVDPRLSAHSLREHTRRYRDCDHL